VSEQTMDPDETEGRALYRARANGLARAQVSVGSRGVRCDGTDTTLADALTVEGANRRMERDRIEAARRVQMQGDEPKASIEPTKEDLWMTPWMGPAHLFRAGTSVAVCGRNWFADSWDGSRRPPVRDLCCSACWEAANAK
jgi:hypothetical protein